MKSKYDRNQRMLADYNTGNYTKTALAEKYGISLPAVCRALDRAKRPNCPHSDIVYDGMAKWMVENDASMLELSKMCNLPVSNGDSQLRRVLRGEQAKISIEVALKLEEITGLTFAEMFGKKRVAN